MKTISILSVVDVVGALADDNLSGNVHLMDNNKANGSHDQGTESLKTVVKKGDNLVWTTLPLECEAYASIEGVLIDKDYCDPQQATYKDTAITYWSGTVKRNLNGAAIPYRLKFQVGNRLELMSTSATPYLVGNRET